MAEPVDRVGAPGVFSGGPLRRFPSATLDELRNICKHYEEKCGGKYAASSPAARYLFQMSREILVQLTALEAWMKEKTTIPDVVAEEHKQWQEHFSPAAKQELLVGLPNAASATPNDVAAYIAQLQDLLQLTREREQKVAIEANEELGHLRSVIASHRAVSRVQAEEDRQRHATELDTAKVEMEDTVRRLSEQYNEVIAQVQRQAKAVTDELEAELASRDEVFEQEASKRDSETAMAVEKLKQELELQYREEFARRKSESDETILQQQRKMDMLQAVLQQTRARMHATSLQAGDLSEGRNQSTLEADLTQTSPEMFEEQAEYLKRCQAELDDQKRLNEVLQRRLSELEAMTDFQYEERELGTNAENEVVLMETVWEVAAAEREIFAQSQVRQRMAPKCWNLTNVDRSVARSSYDAPLTTSAYLKPKNERAVEPWTKAKPVPKDTFTSLFARPGTAAALRQKEKKIHEYCESQRQALSKGAPPTGVEGVSDFPGFRLPGGSSKHVHVDDGTETAQPVDAEIVEEKFDAIEQDLAGVVTKPSEEQECDQKEGEGGINVHNLKAADELDEKLAEDLAATTAPAVPASTLRGTLRRPVGYGEPDSRLPLSLTWGNRKLGPPRSREQAIFEHVVKSRPASDWHRLGTVGTSEMRRSPIV